MTRVPKILFTVVIVGALWGASAIGNETVFAQESGVYAFTWSEPAPQAENLIWVKDASSFHRNAFNQGVDRGQDALQMPEGYRAIFPNQLSFWLAKTGWTADPRENINDRTIASYLNENINGETRSTIAIDPPLPYDLGSGHEIVIQTGDPDNEYLLDGDVIKVFLASAASEGDTQLSIRDDNGDPVYIEADTETRILSNYQSLWTRHAAERIKVWWNDFLDGFESVGAVADWVYIDAEFGINANRGIKHDPRWDDPSYGPEEGKSWKDILSGKGFTIDEVIAPSGNSTPSLVWGSYVSNRATAEGLNYAIFDPAQARFPNVQGSNYEFTGITADEVKWAPNHDGWEQYKPYVFGTHGSHPYYAAIRGLANRRFTDYYSYDNHQHAAVRYMVQYARANYRSTDGKVQPWITYPGLSDAMFNVSVRNTLYYEEYLYHVALYTDKGTPMLYWNARDGGGGGATMEDDIVVDDIISDINTRTGGYYETQTTDPIAWDTKVIKTAVEANGQWHWRITIERVDAGDERPITVEVFEDGTKVDEVVLGAEEVGFWHTSAIGADVTAIYEHPFVPNLLPSDEYLDLTSAVWTQLDPNNPAIEVEGPEPGTTAFQTTRGAITEFSLPEGDTFYTLNFIGRRDQGNSNVRVENPQTDDVLGRSFFTPPVDFDVWGQHRIVFRAPEHGQIRIRSNTNMGSRHSIYQLMLNQGRKHASFVTPSDGPTEDPPTGSSQTITLEEGWNLVGTSIMPEQPALEDILGDAADAITLVKDVDGNLFFPELGLNDIGSWDVGQAYYVLAHTASSFTITGEPVDPATPVAVEPGWNLVPYHGTSSMPMAEAFSGGDETVVMARATGEAVYYPAEAVTTLSHAEPGRGYLVFVTESGLLTMGGTP